MDKDSKLCPIYHVPKGTLCLHRENHEGPHSWEHDGHTLPGCLHSSPKGTECVLQANHPGSCSWDEWDKEMMKQPLTKINPANKEEKDFWEQCFLSLLHPSTDLCIGAIARRADGCLQEYRKRLAHP